MSETWEMKHSVVADVPLETVWDWHSNVDNWACLEGDAVESITLDGPFQSGARGATKIPGQEVSRWRLAEVEPPRRTVIEMELSDAMMRCVWTFDALSEKRTRLTQRIRLEGLGAAAYAPMMKERFGTHLARGMERIAAEIERVAAARNRELG